MSDETVQAGRVLLVNDDRALCEALEIGLRGRGLAVTWRTTADEALLLLESEDFDVTLTDLNMRGKMGSSSAGGSSPRSPACRSCS